MTNPDNPIEVRETKIIMHPGESPVRARALIEWVQPPHAPGEPPLASLK